MKNAEVQDLRVSEYILVFTLGGLTSLTGKTSIDEWVI